jgi:quercetin dioxygenase-like cupin family protein
MSGIHHVRADVRPFDDPQPFKQGAWSSPHLKVAVWRLNPGQRITAHLHPGGDDLMVVLHGTGEYLCYDGVEPDVATQYEPHPQRVVVPPPLAAGDEGAERIAVAAGSVVMVAPGIFHGLVNTGTEQLVAVVVTGPQTAGSLYVTR